MDQKQIKAAEAAEPIGAFSIRRSSHAAVFAHALAGAVTIIVLAATTASAGSGVGASFSLGQTNTVNEKSTLTGAKGGAMLDIVNTSTQAGSVPLKLEAAIGKPPMVVNSSVKVVNLNADKIDGFHANGLGRVQSSSNDTLSSSSSTDTELSVTITAPANGFVRLDGRIIAYDGFENSYCTSCYAIVRLINDVSGVESPMSFASLGTAGAAHSTAAEIPVNWLVPVTAGAHSYSIRTAKVILDGTGFTFYNPYLIAQFIPFNGSGTQASVVAASGMNPALAPTAAAEGSDAETSPSAAGATTDESAADAAPATDAPVTAAEAEKH
jgi:hypothetical protein